MSLTRDQQIRINALLLEREERFVRVHDLEQAVNRLLGAPYPFSRPPLPSDQRTKTKSPGRRPAGATASNPAPRERLRRLEENEHSYRVSYRRGGQRVQEEHTETEALRTLLASQGAHVQVMQIETLDAAGQVLAVLLKAPDAGDASAPAVSLQPKAE